LAETVLGRSDSDAASRAELDALARELRERDAALEAEIALERQERVASDEALSKRMEALALSLSGMGSTLQAELSRLSARAGVLEQELPLRTAETEAKLAEVAARVAALDGREDAASRELRAELLLEVRSLSQAQSAFAEHARTTFGTRAEIEMLVGTTEGLAKAVRTLERVTGNGEGSLLSRVRAEIRAQIDAFGARVGLLELSAEGLVRLETEVTALTSANASLRADALGQVATVRAELAAAQASDALAQSRMKDALEGLGERIAEARAYSEVSDAALVARIEALRAELAGDRDVDAAKRAEILLEMEKLRKECAAQSTALKDDVGLAVAALQTEVARVAALASHASEQATHALQVGQALRDELKEQSKVFAERVGALQADFDARLNEMRGRTESRFDALRTRAQEVTIHLGLEVQRRFTRLTMERADLLERERGLREEVRRYLALDSNDEALVVGIDESLRPAFDTASSRLNDALRAAEALDKEIIDAVDPVLRKSAAQIDRLDQGFAAVASTCKAKPPEAGAPREALGAEWFVHLAREYTFHQTFSARSGRPGPDGVWFSPLPALASEGFGSRLLIGALRSHLAGADAACADAISGWARGLLFTDSGATLGVHGAITKSARARAAVETYRQAIARLHEASESLAAKSRAELRALYGSEEDVRNVCEGGRGNRVAFYVFLAQILVERVQVSVSITDNQSAFERHVEMALEIAKGMKETGANEVARVEAAVASLRGGLEELAAQSRSEIDALDASQRAAFELIATLAARMGYDDVVARAMERVTPVSAGRGVYEGVAPSCVSAQHFYNHATARGLPVTRCESNLSLPGKPLDVREMTRCALHGTGQGNISWTWGNLSTVRTNGWSAQNESSSGGHKVGNGLKLIPYEPTDVRARELARRGEGTAQPADGESVFVLRVSGQAARWRINVTSMADRTRSPYAVTVDAAAFRTGADGAQAQFEIPLPKVAGPLGSCRWDREIEIVALDAAGNPGANKCVHRVHTFSPLVLSFDSAAMVRTVNPSTSRTSFDLDANGTPDRTGWVAAKGGAAQGFLAIDRNGNGRIDDGSELFGEASPGRPANGYLAAASLDANGDAVLDAHDPAFRRLLVWFDSNEDGRSQAWELRGMTSLGVTRLSIRPTAVAARDAIQDHGLPAANLVKYEARFWGPAECGAKGCRSFDVFFGTQETIVSSR
jgi:hypothetical protein